MKQLLIFVALISFHLTIYAQDTKVLRWGGDAEGGAPYVFPDPKNPRQIIGYEVDLMNEIGRKLNRRAVFVQNQWDGLIPGLNRGNYDVAVNGIEITNDRKEQVDFTIPYYATGRELDQFACRSKREDSRNT